MSAQARLSILLDRDYQRLVPNLKDKPTYAEFDIMVRGLNWDEAFSLDVGDCDLNWITAPRPPSRAAAPFGAMGFRWKPANGENMDATGFVLPGVNPKDEIKFLKQMQVEQAVINALGPRPQVFIYTASSGLFRCPVGAHDGNNRMMNKDKLLSYVCDTLGMLGFMAIQHYWGIDVFGK